MTSKLAAAFAAGALAVGILVGAAGTLVVQGSSRTQMGMADMAAMHEMMSSMGGSMMGGQIDETQHDAHHPGSGQ